MKKIYNIYDYIKFKEKIFEMLNLKNSVITELYDEAEYRLAPDFFKKYALYDLLIDIYYNKEICEEHIDIQNICQQAKQILPENTYIDFGISPIILTLCNLNTNFYLQMPKRYMIKSQTKNEDHSILDETLLNLKILIENPICITQSNAKDIITIIIQEKSENDKYIIVPISEYINKNRGIFINQLDSVYGRGNLANYLKNHRIIAYHNKKMNDLVTELGLQLPLCVTHNSFIYDDSITYTLENVKIKNNQENYNPKTDFEDDMNNLKNNNSQQSTNKRL